MLILILERIFEKTRDYLSAKRLLLREGTIVDATIINKTSYKRWIKGQKNLKVVKKSVDNRKSGLQSGFVNFIRGSLDSKSPSWPFILLSLPGLSLRSSRFPSTKRTLSCRSLSLYLRLSLLLVGLQERQAGGLDSAERV